jgi:hypothetical protein
MAPLSESELDSIVHNYTIEVETEATGQKRTLKTYRELKEFFDPEKQFWDKNAGGPGPLGTFRDFFNDIASQIQAAAQIDQDNARNRLNIVVNRLRNESLKAIYLFIHSYRSVLDLHNKEEPPADAGRR